MGVTVAQDGIVNDLDGCLSDLSNRWMRDTHPDLYERWEASRKDDYEGEDDEDDLWEELWDSWCEVESDVADCLRPSSGAPGAVVRGEVADA